MGNKPSMDESNAPPILNLPVEILSQVLQDCDASSLGNIAQTSSAFKRCVEDEHLWKMNCQNHFGMINAPMSQFHRTWKEIYQMKYTGEYVPMVFSRRPLKQQLGIVALTLVFFPFIMIYLTPRICRALVRHTILGSKLVLSYILRPTGRFFANLMYWGFVYPTEQTFKFIAYAFDYSCTALVNNVITPIGDAAVWTFDMVLFPSAVFVYDYIIYPVVFTATETLKFATYIVPNWTYNNVIKPTAKFTYDYILRPTAIGAYNTAKFITHTAPIWTYYNIIDPTQKFTYNYILKPSAIAAYETLKLITYTAPLWIHNNCIAPVANALRIGWITAWINVISPVVNGIRKLLEFTIITAPLWIWHKIIKEPLRFIFVTAPVWIFDNIIIRSVDIIGNVLEAIARGFFHYVVHPLFIFFVHRLLNIVSAVVFTIRVVVDVLGFTWKNIIVPILRTMYIGLLAIIWVFKLSVSFLYDNILTPIGHSILRTYRVIVGVFKFAMRQLFIFFRTLYRFTMVNILRPTGRSLSAIYSAIASFIVSVATQITSIVKALGRFLLVNILSPAASVISSIATAILNLVKQFVADILVPSGKAVMDVLKEIFNTVKDTSTAVANIIKDLLIAIFNVLRDTWTAIKNSLG